MEKIAPVSFKYNGKAGYPNDGKEYIGVIAQDIQKVAPYTIQTIDKTIDENDRENTKLLMYDGTALTYILVNAVKELNADLKESNAALKAENKMLKERLDAIENMLNTLAGKAAEE